MQRTELITTFDLPARERLHYWNEHAGAKIAPLAVHGIGDRQFNAILKGRHFRTFSLMSVASSPAHVESRARPFDYGMLNLTLMLRGTARYEINGLVSDVNPGDLLLYSPEEPIEATYSGDMELLILRLSQADVAERLPRLAGLTGRKVSGAGGGGAVMANFIGDVWRELGGEGEEFVEEGAGASWADHLGTAIWPLLEMAYGPHLAQPSALDDASGMVRRALLDLVENRLCDPALDTAMIAAAQGISPRYVQILFARMGTTPSAYVRNRRLDRAASLLADDRRRSVTSVALDVGFDDLSGFCRHFRARFGVSPARYRMAARLGRA